ncbi:hypothetical protein ACFE04_010506 [Oxalis oulophora]
MMNERANRALEIARNWERDTECRLTAMKAMESFPRWIDVEGRIKDYFRRLVENPRAQTIPEEYMGLYTGVYLTCAEKVNFGGYDYSDPIYLKFRDILEEYLTTSVLPSLREKEDEIFLMELANRWADHRIIVRKLTGIFSYVERYVIRHDLPLLADIGLACFRHMIFYKFYSKTKHALTSQIRKEREGEEVDKTLLKNAINIFVEVCKGDLNLYRNFFENDMMEASSAYYSEKASKWIVELSCPEYMLKAEACLVMERNIISQYLHSSSGPKLVERVVRELMAYATQLLEKEYSGCHKLLKDDKKYNLAMMYRLYNEIPNGLELVADSFKRYIAAECGDMVKSTIAHGSSQVLEKKIAELCCQNMVVVKYCFENNAMFREALREALETSCNKFLDETLSIHLQTVIVKILK